MRATILGSGLSWVTAWLFLCSSPCVVVADEVIDSPMYNDPALPFPRIETVLVDAKELWLKAFARPEAEMRCRAAEAIARAHREGVKGLEVTVPPLRAALDQPGQHPTVRLAVARALVTLDAKEAAPTLFRLSQAGDHDLREIADPALARWDYRPAREAWLSRLHDSSTSERGMVLAIRALGQVREGQAAEKLTEFVLTNRLAASIRLEAAYALGSIRTEGLEKVAGLLIQDATPRAIPARLAAATLLFRHRGEGAVRLLQRLGRDPEPAVAARAVSRLLELDSKHAVPALDLLIASPDATLRGFAVEILFREANESRVRQLADRLDDADPEVRVSARRRLHELAKGKGYREWVIAEASRLLTANSWRGQEQAAVLLVQLDNKPSAGRLVELLKSDRSEVFLVAAWGLRTLDVAETLSAVTDYVREQQRRLRAGALRPGLTYNDYDRQLSQLNQFLGRRKYRPADAVLREFLPKMLGGACPESRAAAVWALGWIHEGNPEPALVSAVEKRLNDAPPNKPPDTLRVRRMAAITLARMNAKGALPSLRRFYADRKASLDQVNNACGWAIERLTGEAMPPPTPIRRRVTGNWFLIRLD
jgi:HEAT repeat protein